MKRIISLLLTAVLLAAMLTVFVLPASAERVEWKEDKTLSGTKVFDDEISLSSVTVEERASVTFNDTCKVNSTMTVKSGASVTFNGSCSVAPGSTLTVESGASVICNGLLYLAISGTITVEKGASLTVNSALSGGNQPETSKVAIGGILKGKCSKIVCEQLNIVLLPGGMIDVEISNLSWKESYLEYYKNLDKNATVELTEDNYHHVMAFVCDHDYTIVNGICTKCKYVVNPELHKHDFSTGKCACGMPCPHESDKTVCAVCGADMPTDSDTTQTVGGEGSTLSEGSLTIIVGVACSVVFLAVGFFIGTKKKKKSALASGESKDEE